MTGFLCDGQSALEQAIGAIAAIGRAACRQHIADNFSADKMVAAHLDLYQWMIERWAAGHGPRR